MTGKENISGTQCMVTGKTERNSSVELLRMLAGMAVVVLHFNYFPGGGGAIDCTSGITCEILNCLECICICAVNVFIMISGFFGADSRGINWGKLLKLLIQTSVFSLCFTVISCVINGGWSFAKIVLSLLPVNYYVVLYVALMVVAPFINITISKLSWKNTAVLAVCAFVLFSVYPTIVDMVEDCVGREFPGLNTVSIAGSGAGYTIINFILVYILGVCIKKLDFVKKFNSGMCIAVLAGAVAVIFFWRKLLPDTAWMYCNPLVIIESAAIIVIFAKMKFRSRFVNLLAPASFTCYLIHENILSRIGTRFIEENSFLGGVMVALIVTVILIYALSFLIMKMWVWITNPIYKHTLDLIPVIIVG